jgi:hypothetical protein
MPDLRKGQYKRLGRISEKNPERAERVAERMDKRASRTERGAEIAANAEEKRTGGRDIARGVARLYDRGEENPRAKKDAVKKITSRDIPLAPTPEPLFSRR